MLDREFWRCFAWLLVLSAVFWSAVALHSCSADPPRPIDHRPDDAPAEMKDQGTHRVIGRQLFTDGIEREVYEDAVGRQYVLDHEGAKVHGLWLYPADEPALVPSRLQP
jgi:hypothetical protein